MRSGYRSKEPRQFAVSTEPQIKVVALNLPKPVFGKRQLVLNRGSSESNRTAQVGMLGIRKAVNLNYSLQGPQLKTFTTPIPTLYKKKPQPLIGHNDVYTSTKNPGHETLIFWNQMLVAVLWSYQVTSCISTLQIFSIERRLPGRSARCLTTGY